MDKILRFSEVGVRTRSLVKNDNAEFVGRIKGEPKFNHENLDKKYYLLYIEAPFKDKTNVLPVLLEESEVFDENGVCKIREGQVYLARGRWSSRRMEDGKFHYFLFTKKIIDLSDVSEEDIQFRNYIELDGYIRRKPTREESYNRYKGVFEKQAKTLITILRPAGRLVEGATDIKTKSDTLSMAFRGNYVGAGLKLRPQDRVGVKGYVEEYKDAEGNVLDYIVIPYEVQIKIEYLENKDTATEAVETPAAE